MHLYETHLPVADTNVAERFYREIVGLPFGYRDPTRDIVFLWADAKEKATAERERAGQRKCRYESVI